MIRSILPLIRENNVKLIIVDSLTKLPRADFSGRATLYPRQQLIGNMITKLRRTALIYNLIVLVTNQVVAIPDAFKGRSVEPVGGHVLGHNVDTRLMFRSISQTVKRVKILDSSWLPPGQTEIMITEAGITDPKE